MKEGKYWASNDSCRKARDGRSAACHRCIDCDADDHLNAGAVCSNPL